MSVKYFGVYTPKIFDGCMSVKCLGGLHPQKILRIYVHQIFDACRCVTYLGVYTPKIFDGCMSVKYLGGLHPQNI